MKLFTPLISYAAAVSIDTVSSGLNNLDGYFNQGTQMQINMMKDAILRNQLPQTYMDKLDEFCNPCRPPVTLEEIMTLLPLPDLTKGDANAEKKLEIFVGTMCSAANCRDRVSNCATRAKAGICQNNASWAQEHCAQTCGCIPRSKQCIDNYVPGVEQSRSARLEDDCDTGDCEHSSESQMSQMELPIHEAIKYLDPSNIFGQFDKTVQKTLQNQMCIVPDANTRIIAANELLKVLAKNEDAQVLNALSPKLPMYLEVIPTSMKNVLANDVICGGYTRDPTAAACLGPRITPDTRYCKANLPRYTYNKDTGYCEAANYDGCYKTENRFLTKGECDETCADYKDALLKVHNQKLERFINSLTPQNLRQSMLLMFGKSSSTESTSDLIALACGAETGNIRAEFREILCDRLYAVLNDQSPSKPSKPIEKKTISQNPVVYEESVCTAKIAEREACVDKPRRGYKAACEEAGCCWDPQPQIKFAKWKHYCSKPTIIQSKPEVVVKQEQLSDSEHSHEHAEKAHLSTCNVDMSERTFCTARDQSARSIREMRESCEQAGCCWAEHPTRGVYHKWRLSCFNPQ